jgi:hypothetical protein
MPLAQVIALLAEYGIPDLIALGKAVYDVIEQKHNAESIARAAVAGAEVAADVAEAKKFGAP